MIGSPLALAFGTYFLAAASPGPSNMAIMGAAMRDGRTPALILASGVMTGSLFWAMLAATGVSTLLATYAKALFVIKVIGGIYLLYLAMHAGRSAMQPTSDFTSVDAGRATRRYLPLYRQGVFMHIGNPKAIMSWMAIMSLGLREDAPNGTLPAIIGGCALLGIIIFGGYAIIFSTARMIAFYTRLRRWIQGLFSALFAVAGLKLLVSPN
ncbi:LysE family translocator [Pseudomonas sp. BN417]|uniref:LysE family translocator n=1 Tax=Pseudomonas sp. BN417 TaxID=2567890 RepID=UPI002453E1F6|nr:LysE family translocator [Pseudomonas sp. BN417]MDH4557916.1 LysE family translocator [Pseudomonas sp. BN417]